MRLPADIEGSVSLRTEQDGFWSRSVSNMIKRLLALAGYAATADEFFMQDNWQPPSSVQDRLLLFLGDPLNQVEVPWKAESLIQNWNVQV
jgi:hypothetical protein